MNGRGWCFLGHGPGCEFREQFGAWGRILSRSSRYWSSDGTLSEQATDATSVRISKIPASHGARGAGGAVLAGETELPSAGLAEDLLTGDVDAELEAEDVAENEAEELDLDGLSDGSAKGEQR